MGKRVLAVVFAVLSSASIGRTDAKTAIHRHDNDLGTHGEMKGEREAIPSVVAAKFGPSDSVFVVNVPRRALKLFFAWKEKRLQGAIFNPETGNLTETPIEIEEGFLEAGLKATNRDALLAERPYVSFVESSPDNSLYLLVKRVAHENTWSAGQTFVYKIESDLSISDMFCLETTSCPCALEKSIPCVFSRRITAFTENEARIEVRKECDEGSGIVGAFSLRFDRKKLEFKDLAVTEKEVMPYLLPVSANACPREAAVSIISAPLFEKR